MKPSFLAPLLLAFFAVAATAAGFNDVPARAAELSQSRPATAALWEMSPLPLTDAEVKAVLGNGTPPDPHGDPMRLAHYWSGYREAPQDVRERLTAVAGQLNDHDLFAVLSLVDPTNVILERIRRYARSHFAKQREEAEAWLVDNDPGRRQERIAKLSAIPEQSILNEEYLLQRATGSDWPGLEPMLQEWCTRPSVSFRAVALATLYRHAVESGDEAGAVPPRAALRMIVEDRSAPGKARWTALSALMMQTEAGYYTLNGHEWPGRDAWLLSLFSDPSLYQIDKSNRLAPLAIVVGGAPDRFVPLVLPMLNATDDVRRENAATALASLIETREMVVPGETPRPEISEGVRRRITKALLPWIAERPLTSEDARRKVYVIDSAARLLMTEAVPLIASVRKEPGLRDAADGALAKLEGISSAELRREIEQRPNENERLWLYVRVWSSARLPADEVAAAVETWARHQSAPGAPTYWWNQTLPVEASIGRFASEHLGQWPDVVKARVRRLEALPPSDRAVADAMAAMLIDSSVTDAMEAIVRRIGKGEADAPLIAGALRRREAFCSSEGTAMAELSRGSGNSRAIAVVMRRDSTAAAKILASGDRDTSSLLLAAARLSRWQLPLQPLATRARSDASFGAMADIYLASVDTPATRALYFARHRGTIPISGQQFPRAKAPTTCGLEGSASPGVDFPVQEEALKRELLSGKVREVRAFFAVDGCRFAGPTIVIRAKKDGSGTVSFQGGMRQGGKEKQRALSEEEVRRLLARLDSFGLESLPALTSATGVWSGGSCEYFRADRNDGRRLILLARAGNDDSGYGKAQRLFGKLADTMEK